MPGGGVVWLKRLGFAGFMFFMIKGLLWLAIPAVVIVWRAMTGSS